MAPSAGIGATNRKFSSRGPFERGLPSQEPSIFFSNSDVKMAPSVRFSEKKRMVLQRSVDGCPQESSDFLCFCVEVARSGGI